MLPVSKKTTKFAAANKTIENCVKTDDNDEDGEGGDDGGDDGGGGALKVRV